MIEGLSWICKIAGVFLLTCFVIWVVHRPTSESMVKPDLEKIVQPNVEFYQRGENNLGQTVDTLFSRYVEAWVEKNKDRKILSITSVVDNVVFIVSEPCKKTD